LEAGEKYAHVKIGSGDIVLVRTGHWARRAKLGAWNVARQAAGLDASTMPWLKQRDISVLAGDGVNDGEGSSQPETVGIPDSRGFLVEPRRPSTPSRRSELSCIIHSPGLEKES
jgi:hypothetical protein